MPTPYAEVIFRALHKADFINLLVNYERDKVPSHPWKTNFRYDHNSRVQTPGIDFYLIKQLLTDKNAFFIGGWSSTTSVFIIILCMIFKRKFILETDTPTWRRKRSWFFARARSLFLRAAFKRAVSSVLYAGQQIANERLQQMGASGDKLIYFPYWVDVDFFRSPGNKTENTSLLKFISVGRICNDLKGHDIAIRALSFVYSRNPEFSFEYCILGTGPDIGKLTRLVNKLGLSRQVKILGWREPDDVKNSFLRSDILIHPSPVDEPYGVAVIEAMAAGLVVLASDVTFAALDRIVNGVNGFIYKADDILALADQIEWCFQNKCKLPEIGRAAEKTASQWHVNKGVEIIKSAFLGKLGESD